MRTLGSQKRETLNEAQYTFVKRVGPRVIVLADEDGKLEVWIANNNHAGYTIQVGRWGYEFVGDYKE
jgi:hypothetical protein